MFNRILAVVGGLVATVLVVMLTDGAGIFVHPLPEGVSMQDTEAISEHVKNAPISAMLLLFFGYILAAFVGGAVTGRIAYTQKMTPALIMGLLFTLISLYNTISVGHQTWFFVHLLFLIPAAALGCALFNKFEFVTNSKRTINKPVKEVWDFMDNADNLKLWLQGFERFEPISGEQGKVGAKAKHVYIENGRTIEMIEEIKAINPYQSAVLEISNPDFSSYIENKFTDHGDSTELDWRVVTTIKGILFKMMTPFIGKGFEDRQEGDIERFKQAVENQN